MDMINDDYCLPEELIKTLKLEIYQELFSKEKFYLFQEEHAIDFELLREQVADPLVKAVGETGLDYFYTAETATEQKKLFAEHCALAAEFEKPLVVHTRDADEDTVARGRCVEAPGSSRVYGNPRNPRAGQAKVLLMPGLAAVGALEQPGRQAVVVIRMVQCAQV